jgi:CheY-like chemotaxis protein
MGGQLDLHSEAGEGTTFFFTIDFEEIETLNESVQGSYSSINALVLESAHKTKRQETYLREYLDYYGVSYTSFKDMDELEVLQRQVSYDLVIIDYDYADEHSLKTYSDLPQELILLTKSYFMKKIDSMQINTFKTIYEPLNNTKLKQALENYHNENFNAKKAKKISRKKFNADTSKFRANVLVAEDNIINQKLIKRTLEDLGLTISIASNGLEAFQKRKDGNFDLIFMDIQMPFLDGMEATKEILEYEEEYNQPHVPILALTANALKGDRERFLAAGLDEYTTKPLVRSEIVSLLNHFLADYIVENDHIPHNVSDLGQAKDEPEAAVDEKVVAVDIPAEEIEPEASQDMDAAEEVLQELADETAEVTSAEETQEEEPQEELFEEIEVSDEELEVSDEELEVSDEEVELDIDQEIELDTAEDVELEVNEEVELDIAEDEELEVDDSDFTLEEEPEVQTPLEVYSYKADIVLAKKSKFEAKLFTKILASLGYSFEVANSVEELEDMLSSDTYKLVLFDKECKGLSVEKLSSLVQETSEAKNLDSALVLITDPATAEDENDAEYVNDAIKNVVNKDLLRLVVEKFI